MNSRLAPCAYLVALLLIFIPLFDASMSVAPWSLGNAQWRFGAVGLLSNALMLPALGALIAVTTAVTLDHEWTIRTLRVWSWIACVVIVLSIVLFALDAIQTRAAISPEMALSYRVASVTAAFKLLLGAVAFALFGRACRPAPMPAPVRPNRPSVS